MATNSNAGPTLPSWLSSIMNVLGYVLGFAAGAFSLIYGIVFAAEPAIPIMWGAAIIVCVAIALISGAKAKPSGSLSTKKIKFGGKFSRVPMVAWIIIAAIILVCAILSFFVL